MSTIYHLLIESECFSDRTGGALSRWAANTLRTGEEIVVCPSSDDSWGFPAERIYHLPNWGRTSPIHPILYRLPWTLQKEVYRHVFRPILERVAPGDVIYVHNAPESASALANVADQHGIKIVLHMHNSHLARASRGQLAALKKWPIVFCSEFLRKEVHQALPGHFETTHIVYNGADASRFCSPVRALHPIPTVVFTGRLVPYKGVHILVEAMRRLEERGISARCKIAGRTYFASKRGTRYTRQLRRSLPANTEMVGYKSGNDLAQLLHDADIFCCPSIWNDPFPLAPLEAMAAGLPVVASSTGGLPEMLAHGGGIMVPPNNVGALADALEHLVTDTGHRRQLSEQALATYQEHFLWSNVRRQYETVIREVLA